ncbi:MAG TPA: type II secretion system F family protein [Verrucomicrobiae bacterium]|nr:type II secretion system F family protein [Verrucomicrobiae bacterium]
MITPVLQLLFWFALWLAPLAIAIAAIYFLVSLPLRRQERARFFLDLLELGLKEGRTPEQTIVAVSRSDDPSMGARFHLLAAHLESGLPLGQAVEKVPRLLPPQINAMLKTGEEIGDVFKVLPACRQLLNDGSSETRGAMNYLVVVFLVLTPVAPAIFQVLATFVFPKFLVILHEMEVTPPAFTAYVISRASVFASVMSAAAFLVYLAGIIYLGGPRLTGWIQSHLLPICDRLAFHLPWRRKRMQRDFAAMLGILLDANVPEERAVTMAAASAANSIFKRRADRAVADLRAGMKLPEAMRRLDDTDEFLWRLTNASHSPNGFRAALNGWLEALDAKAFQQQQAAAHVITTALVVINGALVGVLVVGTFQALIAIVNAGVLW